MIVDHDNSLGGAQFGEETAICWGDWISQHAFILSFSVVMANLEDEALRVVLARLATKDF